MNVNASLLLARNSLSVLHQHQLKLSSTKQLENMLQADRSTLLTENLWPCLLTYSKHFLIINMSGNFISNSTHLFAWTRPSTHYTWHQQTREVFREDIPSMQVNWTVNLCAHGTVTPSLVFLCVHLLVWHHHQWSYSYKMHLLMCTLLLTEFFLASSLLPPGLVLISEFPAFA